MDARPGSAFPRAGIFASTAIAAGATSPAGSVGTSSALSDAESGLLESVAGLESAATLAFRLSMLALMSAAAAWTHSHVIPQGPAAGPGVPEAPGVGEEEE